MHLRGFRKIHIWVTSSRAGFSLEAALAALVVLNLVLALLCIAFMVRKVNLDIFKWLTSLPFHSPTLVTLEHSLCLYTEAPGTLHHYQTMVADSWLNLRREHIMPMGFPGSVDIFIVVLTSDKRERNTVASEVQVSVEARTSLLNGLGHMEENLQPVMQKVIKTLDKARSKCLMLLLRCHLWECDWLSCI